MPKGDNNSRSKAKNEFDQARHRYEVRQKAEKRTEERKAAQSRQAQKESVENPLQSHPPKRSRLMGNG